MHEVVNNFTAIFGFISFMAVQIISYNKLKWQVDQLDKHLNGIGAKVRDIDKKVGEYHVEEILRQSSVSERITCIEKDIDILLDRRHHAKAKNGIAS